MAALRNAARFCGPCPSFTWHLSSPNVTLRTQCKLSIPQWPCQRVINKVAPPLWRERLLIAYCTSTVFLPLEFVVRSKRQTCFRPGQSRCSAKRVLAWRCRCTSRPCPLLEGAIQRVTVGVGAR